MQEPERKQVAGFVVSPDWIVNPDLADSYIALMAESRYLAAVIFIRHQSRTHVEPGAREAVRQITDKLHAAGIKAILDTDPFLWTPYFAERHPTAVIHAISGMDVSVHDGKFSFIMPMPAIPAMNGAPVRFHDVAAVFRTDGPEAVCLPPADYSADWMNAFNENVPHVAINGTVRNLVRGKLRIYLTFKSFGIADVAHPLYLQAQEELLEQYRGIPLDGFGWDEPGKGMSNLLCFKSGEGFLRLFQETNGYDLRTRLILLDRYDNTEAAVKVRCDYYRTLAEANFTAQERHNRKAKELFGEHLIFGTHQTWSGIPADLAGGVFDYFRLGTLLTAAWTDGGWKVELKYPALHVMLAESIKKELGMRDAYYNDWGDSVPAVETMRFANHFRMLYQVNWFNIFFSDFSEYLLNYRLEPLRAAVIEEAANFDRFDQLLGDRFVSHTDIAVLYTWEGMAAAPKWLTRLVYTAYANLSLHLADAGFFGAFISPDGLGKAKAGKGCFTAGTNRYRALVVPFANALRRDVYDKIMALAKAGVPVIVFGPPPERLAETGHSIRDEFAAAVGMDPFSFDDYATGLAERHLIPVVNAWEPSWVDYAYPARATTGLAQRDAEGNLLWIRAADRPLFYMPAVDPREDLITALAPFHQPPADIVADGTYCRIFAEDGGASGEMVVLAVAKAHAPSFALAPDVCAPAYTRPPLKHRRLAAVVKFPFGSLTLKGGSWCAVRVSRSGIQEQIGDSPAGSWTT